MAPPAAFRAPKGTQDVMPPESHRWEALLAIFAWIAHGAGYGLVQSPMFEDIGVFLRLGEGTEVVTKEMYDFEDKGGRRIALRPEGTAPVARAFVEHRPPTPWKVWYATPGFRYEQPQAGRLRQHHQVGIEAIGSADPDLDVEVIALGVRFLRELGLQRWRLVLNFMGTPADRVRYADDLRAWLRDRSADLAPEDAAKIEAHPLRVLDSKRPSTQAVVAEAPTIGASLDDASAAHGERVQAGLRALGIDYELDPKLVRGLDYYTHTLFELQSDAVEERPVHHLRRWPLRRAHRAARRPPYAWHRLRVWHRACAAHVRRRGCVPARGATVGLLRRRRHRWPGRAGSHRAAALGWSVVRPGV